MEDKYSLQELENIIRKMCHNFVLTEKEHTLLNNVKSKYWKEFVDLRNGIFQYYWHDEQTLREAERIKEEQDNFRG